MPAEPAAVEQVQVVCFDEAVPKVLEFERRTRTRVRDHTGGLETPTMLLNLDYDRKWVHLQEDLVIAHTSDLHLGAGVHGDDGTDPESLYPLRQVLAAAQQAHVLLVAGDLFDNNRLPLSMLEAAAKLLAAADVRTVILPGNHDPLTPDSVYHRGPIAQAPNVSVLGLSVGESVVFPQWDLEVWGRAHRDYSDMSPLADPPRRSRRWRIAVAHGHYDEDLPGESRWWPSWRIRTEDLAAAHADYIALGHWNRAARVGDGVALAYYSGSPDLAGTVNLVRLALDGGVQVTREPLLPVHDGRIPIEGDLRG